jgi:predicted phage tail protein
VSAQTGEEHSLSFWHDEALKIALFSSSPLSTSEAYTLEFEAMELRVKRAGIGLSFSTVALVAGAVLVVTGATYQPDSGPDALFIDPTGAILLASGVALLVGGAAGMIASGVVRRKAKRKLRELQRAH